VDARNVDSRLADLRSLYDRATFSGDGGAIAHSEEVLSSLEADLSMARGRLAHAQFLAGSERAEADRDELAQFERAAELYGSVADERGLADALLWIGIAHQVVGGNPEAASEPLHRSYELARNADDLLTLSYAARHLGFLYAARGERPRARELLDESLAIRRRLDFQPGIAAALLAVAEFAAEDGDRQSATSLLDEAERVAHGCEAAGVLRWISVARDALSQ
jgi:tetratricopeptide (TPR) repeat protein